MCIRGKLYLCVSHTKPCMQFLVSCLPLNNPNNGMISCSLGDDGVPSYEDTCSFTCNTGYELAGSDTRTCQSNRRWNGTDDVCRKGTYDYFKLYILDIAIGIFCARYSL